MFLDSEDPMEKSLRDHARKIYIADSLVRDLRRNNVTREEVDDIFDLLCSRIQQGALLLPDPVSRLFLC